MKITPVNHHLLNFNKYNCRFQFKKETELSAKPLVFTVGKYYPFLGVKKNFSYKPIASLKPIKEFIGNYDDLDKFSELYAKKINSNLLIPTEDDIENLVLRIQVKTKASKNQIRNVLYNLTCFSSYRSFDELSKAAKENDIGRFGLNDGSENNMVMDSITNAAVEYLAANKHFCELKGNKIGIILDSATLTSLENIKNSDNKNEKSLYTKFLSKISNDEIVFFNIKGWDIKTKSDGYKNANFLSGSGYLEDVAIDVIKQLQLGSKEDSIYYSDFKERLNNLAEDKKINIVDIQIPNKSVISNSDILDNLNPKGVTAKDIKTMVLSYLFYKEPTIYNKKVRTALLKYLDEQTMVYSADKLALTLKNMAKKIEKYLKEENISKEEIYLIPKFNKSFSLIGAMYQQINNINPLNIKYTDCLEQEDSDSDSDLKNSKGPKVILDDISASGTTEKDAVLEIKKKIDSGGTIIYAPVVLCKSSQLSAREKDTTPDKYCYETYLKDMGAINSIIESEKANAKNYSKLDNITLEEEIGKDSKLLNSDECKILLEIVNMGYKGAGACVVFPHMIPDNSSDICALLFKNLLYKNNGSTNKPIFTHFSNYELSVYRKIQQMANELTLSARV